MNEKNVVKWTLGLALGELVLMLGCALAGRLVIKGGDYFGPPLLILAAFLAAMVCLNLTMGSGKPFSKTKIRSIYLLYILVISLMGLFGSGCLALKSDLVTDLVLGGVYILGGGYAFWLIMTKARAVAKESMVLGEMYTGGGGLSAFWLIMRGTRAVAKESTVKFEIVDLDKLEFFVWYPAPVAVQITIGLFLPVVLTTLGLLSIISQI